MTPNDSSSETAEGGGGVAHGLRGGSAGSSPCDTPEPPGAVLCSAIVRPFSFSEDLVEVPSDKFVELGLAKSVDDDPEAVKWREEQRIKNPDWEKQMAATGLRIALHKDNPLLRVLDVAQGGSPQSAQEEAAPRLLPSSET